MAHNMNDEIKRIGLTFNGHFNTSQVKVEGTNWSIVIPHNRVREFCKLFPDVDWENEEYLNVLVGRYIRVTFDDEMKVYCIHHIVKDIDYLVCPDRAPEDWRLKN